MSVDISPQLTVVIQDEPTPLPVPPGAAPVAVLDQPIACVDVGVATLELQPALLEDGARPTAASVTVGSDPASVCHWGW
jgi:hypothetical protein